MMLWIVLSAAGTLMYWLALKTEVASREIECNYYKSDVWAWKMGTNHVIGLVVCLLGGPLGVVWGFVLLLLSHIDYFAVKDLYGPPQPPRHWKKTQSFLLGTSIKIVKVKEKEDVS